MKRKTNCARRSSAPAWLVLAAAVLLFAPVNKVTAEGADGSLNPFLVFERLIDPERPMPAMPIRLPLATTSQDIEIVVRPGNNPAVFFISPTGTNVQAAKIVFVESMAPAFLNKLTFVLVAAGSDAARILYPGNVTKPVYVFVDPKTGIKNAVVLDEAKQEEVTQKKLESVIEEKFGTQPDPWRPVELTASNVIQVVFNSPPVSQQPTANWMSIIYYPARPQEWAATTYRLRAMLFMESLYFAGRIRKTFMAEGPAYTKLLGEPAPNEPELLVVVPQGQGQTVKWTKYTPGRDGPPLDKMTHYDYVAWLQWLGVAGPVPDELTIEVFQEEARRQRALQQVLTSPR
jgi:hypothetical protein